MKILAFDTSTDACSVALEIDGALALDHRVEPRAHARLLLPMIDALLKAAGLTPASLDALVFGRGPGSFTGVRIAVAAAQGLGFGADIGVVGVSSLAAVAEGCRRHFGDARVRVALDARMGEIYVADHRADPSADDAGRVPVMRLSGEERVVAPAAFVPELAAMGLVFAGSGIERYRELLVPPGVTDERVRGDRAIEARDCLALARERIAAGALDPAELALPVYLRDKVALTERERGKPDPVLARPAAR